MSDQDHPFFVRISAPDMLRVSLLESSKLVLHGLQSYYKVSSIRKKKTESLEMLKSEVKELVLLMGKLESMLPYQDILTKELMPTQAKMSKGSRPKQTMTNAQKEVVATDVTPSFSEIDRLNRALASIEEKLNRIG
ncbi:MAG: hypothetical protein KC535_00255 [Nanoarchaeota archaeon]|nr:hypothetical protein [Nanoarchaeota archaeon]